MGLTNSDYEAVMREYDSIRYENAELLHNRTKEVYEKLTLQRKLSFFQMKAMPPPKVSLIKRWQGLLRGKKSCL